MFSVQAVVETFSKGQALQRVWQADSLQACIEKPFNRQVSQTLWQSDFFFFPSTTDLTIPNLQR